MASLSTKMDTHDENIKSNITTSRDIITNAINGVKNDITQQETSLKNIINAKGCVKSVQRISATVYSDGQSCTKTIEPVDVSKTILLFNVGGHPFDGYIPCGFGHLESSTSVRFGASHIGPADLSGGYNAYASVEAWVIEFY